MPKYKMLHDGGTTGAKTKKEYKYTLGNLIEAPEGEFNHLGRGAYEIVKEEAPKPDAPNAGETQTRLAGGSPTTQDAAKDAKGK